MARGKQRRYFKVKGSTKRRTKQPNRRRSRVSRPLSRFDGPLGLILGGLLLGVLVLGVTGLVLMRKGKHPRSSPPSAQQVGKPSPEPLVQASAEPTTEAALFALNQFFESTDLESMVKTVHEGERVRPMMEDFYVRRGHPFPTMAGASKGQATEVDGSQLVLFMVEPFSGPRFPVAVVWEGDRFAVDWESLVAYGTVDWAQFTEVKPTTVETLRVYVQDAGELDKIPWAPAGYSHFRVSHRDDPQPVAAIANAQVSATLLPMVEGRRIPMTLELEWRPLGPGKAKVPFILGVVAKGWSH